MSNPSHGWASAEEFRAEVDAFLERVKATLESFLSPKPSPQPEPSPEPEPTPTPPGEPTPEPEPSPEPEPTPEPEPEAPDVVVPGLEEYPIWPKADRKPAPQLPGCDEDEPENWHLVHSTEKATPKNPKGPTWTRYTGKRFSSDWGLPTFEWSGHKWFQHLRYNNARPQAPNPRTGRRSFIGGGRVQPDGSLLLRSEGINGGAEVVLVDSTGYGTYEFEYGASFDKMHYSAVLGIFSYTWNEFNHGGGYTEMDFIEISQWNNPRKFGPQYGSVSYYHDELEGDPVGQQIVPSTFTVPAGYQRLTTKVVWKKNYLKVTTTTEDGKVLGDFETRDRVPRDNDQQIRLQLWTCQQEDRRSPYQDWVNAWPDEVVFYRFDYTPEPSGR